MEITIVGMKYRENYDADELKNSDEYKLSFDLYNDYDSNAIATYYRHKCRDDWVHFGYITKSQNTDAELRNMIQEKKYVLRIKRVYDGAIYAIVEETRIIKTNAEFWKFFGTHRINELEYIGDDRIYLSGVKRDR